MGHPDEPAVAGSSPKRPLNYKAVPVTRPTSLGKVLSAGLGRISRAALTKPRATPPPAVVLEFGPRSIDREGMAEYQRLIGSPISDAVPTGWVHVMAFPLHLTLMARPDFPLPPLGMVHVRNTVRHLRAIAAPEELTFACWAENLRPHKRGATIDICVSASVGQELVWQGVSTYLAKGGIAPDDAAPTLSGKSEVPKSPLGDLTVTRHALAPEDLPEELPGHHRWSIPKGIGRAYAEVSGDSNPIHTNALAAKAFGFRAPITHGMYTAARALAEVPHGDSFTWSVDFYSPITPPKKVTLEFGEADGGAGTIMRVTSRAKIHLVAAVTGA